jgi:hypothetical protein
MSDMFNFTFNFDKTLPDGIHIFTYRREDNATQTVKVYNMAGTKFYIGAYQFILTSGVNNTGEITVYNSEILEIIPQNSYEIPEVFYLKEIASKTENVVLVFRTNKVLSINEQQEKIYQLVKVNTERSSWTDYPHVDMSYRMTFVNDRDVTPDKCDLDFFLSVNNVKIAPPLD